jgi:hypothetical protein
MSHIDHIKAGAEKKMSHIEHNKTGAEKKMHEEELSKLSFGVTQMAG